MPRIDQAPELREMPSPPLIGVCYRNLINGAALRLLSPPAPVAIKRVHAVGHVDSRVNQRGPGRPVFRIKFYVVDHNEAARRCAADCKAECLISSDRAPEVV
jgi:hypothetical protein